MSHIASLSLSLVCFPEHSSIHILPPFLPHNIQRYKQEYMIGCVGKQIAMSAEIQRMRSSFAGEDAFIDTKRARKRLLAIDCRWSMKQNYCNRCFLQLASLCHTPSVVVGGRYLSHRIFATNKSRRCISCLRTRCEQVHAAATVDHGKACLMISHQVFRRDIELIRKEHKYALPEMVFVQHLLRKKSVIDSIKSQRGGVGWPSSRGRVLLLRLASGLSSL
jgi:hypothetical protein